MGGGEEVTGIACITISWWICSPLQTCMGGGEGVTDIACITISWWIYSPLHTCVKEERGRGGYRYSMY